MNREIKFRAWDIENEDFVYKEQIYYWEKTFFKYPRYIVQQFTGLKDKNGVDIYEGDIIQKYCGVLLKTKTENPQIIEWYQENCCFGISGYMQITKFDCLALEVIGNIYQNTELLK